MKATGLLAGVLTMFLAGSAPAQNIDSCEKIKDADAYNRCLAGFGPAATLRSLSHGVPSEGGMKAVGKERQATGRRKAEATVPTGPKITRSAQGRMRMEWLVPAR